MSAESDLLFPQMDSAMFSDFSNFSEYDEDIFLDNEIDGLALLEDLDCKDLKPLLMSELIEFSSSLEGIKEEDEEEDKSHEAPFKSCASKPREASGGPLQAASKMNDRFISENPTMESLMNEAEGNLVSPRTMLTTHEMRHMSLEEDIVLTNSDTPWHALKSRHLPCTASVNTNALDNLPLVAQGDMHIQSKEASFKEMGSTTPKKGSLGTPPKNGIMQLSCTSETTPTVSPLRQGTASAHNRSRSMTRPPTAPSIFHINSPLSPPSSLVSTPDWGSILKMCGQEENIKMHHMNTSILQPTACIDSGLRSPNEDAYHGGIPHRVLQDVPSLSTMHRSRSSHALGQFRTSGHLSTCPEEFSLSSMQIPTMGFSSGRNFPPYHASCSPGLVERSSATPMRRVLSTGDIQAHNGMQICYGDNNLSRLEHVSSDEHLGLKAGHYTLEERKVRLHRYRRKRNERNFNKKIKYACRKTLADSRPRIRGRFARTLDDSGEPLLKDNGASYDDEYEEVNMLSAHCNMPNRPAAVNFWNATGMNVRVEHDH